MFKLYVKFVETAAFLERLVNLHYWEDEKRTFFYITFLLILIFMIYMFTFRLLVMLLIGIKFILGYDKYDKIYKKNYELVDWTLDYIILQQLPEYH